MATRLTDALGLAGVLLLASTAAGAAQEIIYACSGADGSISFSSTPAGDHCERFAGDVPAAAPTSPPPAPVAAANETAKPGIQPERVARKQEVRAPEGGAPATATAAVELPPLPDRLARYRQAMVMGAQGAQGAPAAATNPAVNRRYHMTDRASYMAARQ